LGCNAFIEQSIEKKNPAEVFYEVPEKEGATPGDEYASVRPCARCGQLSPHYHTQTTAGYALLKACCLAHACEDFFVLVSAII